MIEIVTTTQIQRNPSILTDFSKSSYKFIIKNGKKVAGLVNLNLLNKVTQSSESNKKIGYKSTLPKELLKKIQAIDPIKFQQEMRQND